MLAVLAAAAVAPHEICPKGRGRGGAGGGGAGRQATPIIGNSVLDVTEMLGGEFNELSFDEWLNSAQGGEETRQRVNMMMAGGDGTNPAAEAQSSDETTVVGTPARPDAAARDAEGNWALRGGRDIVPAKA